MLPPPLCGAQAVPFSMRAATLHHLSTGSAQLEQPQNGKASAQGAPQPSHPHCLGLLFQGKALTWIPELAQQSQETGGGDRAGSSTHLCG